MKKFSALIVFIFLLYVANAQNSFRFGLTASPLLSWNKADATNVDNDGSNVGFQYGVMADVNFEERYALGTGILITNAGGSIVTTMDSSTVTLDQKLQYLEVPVTLKLKTTQVGYLSYFGQFGFTPGVPVRKRGDITTVTNGVSTTEDNAKLDNINDYNLALTVGGGIEYAIDNRTAIIAGIIFNNGFTNIIDDEDGDKISLNNIIFRVGVFF